jgi:hypothetical protein
MKRIVRTAKFILPALTEASSPYWRPIKYSLFPPLGLAVLASYLDTAVDITLVDEHVVYRTRGLSEAQLKAGYDRAYQEFYRWSNIFRGSLKHSTLKRSLKHFFYTAGWKKFEPVWNLVITTHRLQYMRPLFEAVLSRVTDSFAKQDEDSHDDVAVSPLKATESLPLSTLAYPLEDADFQQ